VAPAKPAKLQEKSIAGKDAPPASQPAAAAPADAKAVDSQAKGQKTLKAETEKKTDVATKPEAVAGAGKPSKSSKAAPAIEADPVSLVDLRVGRIVKVWNHPSAERLYCEEIDVGEGAPRQIASGLREHYKLEEMENRLVIVVCNLKPRPLQGFESNGW
jgi:aminoacyl tRNA synthase complex-interacting multifunctional protein 1